MISMFMATKYGWTSLSWADKKGHESVVQLLNGQRDVRAKDSLLVWLQEMPWVGLVWSGWDYCTSGAYYEEGARVLVQLQRALANFMNMSIGLVY